MRGDTIRNLKRWLEIVRMYNNPVAYILCDNELLKDRVINVCNLSSVRVEFLKSDYSNSKLTVIVNSAIKG